jgi:hypothetical protein
VVSLAGGVSLFSGCPKPLTPALSGEFFAERLRIERVKHPEPGKRKKVKDPYAG